MRCWSYVQNSQPPADTLFSNLSAAEIPILCNVLMPLAFLRCHIHWSRIPCMKRPSSCIADTRHFIHTDVGICAHVDTEDLADPTDAIARRHAIIHSFLRGFGRVGPFRAPQPKAFLGKGCAVPSSVGPSHRSFVSTVPLGWVQDGRLHRAAFRVHVAPPAMCRRSQRLTHCDV